MRKLGKALYHVGRGAAFDSKKLFDTSRLRFAAEPGHDSGPTDFPTGDLLLQRNLCPGKSAVCLEAPRGLST